MLTQETFDCGNTYQSYNSSCNTVEGNHNVDNNLEFCLYEGIDSCGYNIYSNFLSNEKEVIASVNSILPVNNDDGNYYDNNDINNNISNETTEQLIDKMSNTHNKSLDDSSLNKVANFPKDIDISKFYYYDEIPLLQLKKLETSGIMNQPIPDIPATKRVKRKYSKRVKISAETPKKIRKYPIENNIYLNYKDADKLARGIESDHNYIIGESETLPEICEEIFESDITLNDTVIIEKPDYFEFIDIEPNSNENIQKESDFIIFDEFS